MPAVTKEESRTLTVKYEAAYRAYQTLARAVTDAGINGERASPALLEQELAAIHELAEARANLLAAMNRIVAP